MRKRAIKLAKILVVLGAMVAGTLGLLNREVDWRVCEPKSEGSVETALLPSELPWVTVKPSAFTITVVKGLVEPVRTEDVVSPVEGAAVILSMLPEGTRIPKGALVCTLEPSSARYVEFSPHRRGGPSVSAKEVEHAVNVPSQVERCELHAPADGTVLWDARPYYGLMLRFKPGDTVIKGQCILQLYDPAGAMRVRTKLHEDVVDQIPAGLPARIRLEPYPDERFPGTVREVGPLPLSDVIRASPFYETLVSIDGGSPVACPGMNAEVEILSGRDNVLSVPREAALFFWGKYLAAVKRSDGGFDWREITLGARTKLGVEVKRGLQSGDYVCLKPLVLMHAQENAKHAGLPSPPVSR